MAADRDCLRVLELVEQHRITAAEAAELIAALAGQTRDGGGEGVSAASRAPVLRVRVTDARTGRIKTNVTLPAAALAIGHRLARRLRVPGPGVQDDVLAAVRAGRHGFVLACANDHGERVEFFLE